MHLTEESAFGPGFSYRKFKQTNVTAQGIGIDLLVIVVASMILYTNLSDAPYGVIDYLSFAVNGFLLVMFLHSLCSKLLVLWAPSLSQSWGNLPDYDTRWVAELDLYPDAPKGEFHRKFVSTGGETPAEAHESILEEHDVAPSQIVHLRRYAREETELLTGVTADGAPLWIDRRDGPVKVYSISQYGEGLSLYTRNTLSGEDFILHSIAGISNHHKVKYNDRTFAEMIAHNEIHELAHWALESDEQPEGPEEELGWHDVIWDAMDHAASDVEQQNAAYFDPERRMRIELTRDHPGIDVESLPPIETDVRPGARRIASD